MICDGPIEEAIEARDSFMNWATDALDLPCFAYGPERSLPEVRRGAFRGLAPEKRPERSPPRRRGPAPSGPDRFWSPTTSGSASTDLEIARSIARRLRGPAVRSLGLFVGDRVQVSNRPDRPVPDGSRRDLRPGRPPCRRITGMQSLGQNSLAWHPCG